MGAVVDGKVWVMGGFIASTLDVTRRVDIYDPSNDSWQPGPDLPGAETHAGVVTLERDILLTGGFVGNVIERKTTAEVWRFDAATSSWLAGPELPTARAGAAVALLGTELHSAGGLAADGDTDSADHVVWDLAGAAAWTSAAPLPIARNHGGGAATGGLFFAIAGRHGWDEATGDDATLDAFNPATGTWQQRAPMPLARSEIGGSTLVLDDGRLLVLGGSIPGAYPSGDALIYDPELDAWSALPPLPRPLKGAVAARVGTKLIVTTGSPTSIDPSATTYIGCCL